jgi:hypothetical protein
LYAQSMAGYLQWLAPSYLTLRSRVQKRSGELRQAATTSGQHLRTPENLANLGVGIEMFLRFAQEKEAITAEERQKAWDHCWGTLMTLGAAQNVQQQNEDPIREAVRLLASADQAGQLFFRSPDGFETSPAPRTDNFIGWRKDEDSEWWCDPRCLYARIVRLFREQERTLPLKQSDFFQRMIDRGYLRRRDEPNRYTVKRLIDGKRLRVILLTPEAFAKAENEVMDGGNSGAKTADESSIASTKPTQPPRRPKSSRPA